MIQIAKKAGLCFLPLFLMMSLTLAARPRVGIVLSGGGAKGAAHIGALRVIEEAGIPVDIIVGTSMGSIVGGLYAIGYTTDQLDSIFMAQDWNTLLADKASRNSLTLHEREQESKYILSVPFFEKPQDLISGGVVKGRNIGRMLWQLTEGYHDSIDYQTLPVPFACVTQDLVTGAEIVCRSGVLPVSIRASMSIPGVFAPVAANGQLLIDGGIVNNYPVDIAKQMGADIIIGVDVQDPMKTANELQGNIFAQLSQLIDLQRKERWEKNINSTDIYIKVDVKGFNTASFNTTSIDSLISRGEQAARLLADTLRAVGRQTNEADSVVARPTPPYFYAHLPGNIEARHAATLKTLMGETPQNSINLGLRFDNEELAALLFNGKLTLGRKRNQHVGMTIRLGMKVCGDAHYGLNLGHGWNLTTGYRFTYNDFDINNGGERAYSVNFHHHLGELGFTKSWKSVRIKLTGMYNLYDYGSFLYRFEDNTPTDIGKESYLKFDIQYGVSTLNDPYFPTKGSEFELEYFYAIPLNHNKSFHTVQVAWKSAFSFNSRFTLMPRIESRYLTTENTVAEMNTLGGQEKGKYFDQQVPFYGISHFEMSRRSLVVAGVEARQRIGGKHYVGGVFNAALTSDDWMHFFKNSFGRDSRRGYHAFGGAIKYDMRTFIGPVGITLSFSDWAKFSGYIRAGFNF